MEFQLFDRVRVKLNEKALSDFTNAKSGWITNYNQKMQEYEVEFATGSISARVLIPKQALEKVIE